jgi:hypothetical protein
MEEFAEILGWPRDKLQHWYRHGVVVPDEKLRRKGSSARYSDDNIVQLLVVDRLADAGISLAMASKISQDCLRGCSVMDWDPRVEITLIWVNLEDPTDFVMLPDYEFDSVGFAPDSEKSYLIIPLKPIYRTVADLITIKA